MQLLCNRVELELQDNSDLTFQKINPLFAFDKLACERTQSFKVPATAHNERVFGLAKLPAYNGQAMRVKFDCEMRSGYIVKKGYLYVDTYESGYYNCIFVTGELVGLQKIKDLGKLKDIVYLPNTIEIGADPINAQASLTSIWQNVKYKRAQGIALPSMLIKQIVEAVVSQNNLPAITLPAAVSGYRVIVNEPKLPESDAGTLASVVTGSWSPTMQGATIINTIQPTKAGIGLWQLDYDNVPRFAWYNSLGANPYQYYKIRAFRALANLELEIPEDWDDNVYICKYRNESGTIFDTTDLDFLGDRYFTKYQNAAVVVYGESLKGRKVEVEYGQQILFVTPDMFDNSSQQIGTQTRELKGFNITDISVSLAVSGGTAQAGWLCRLQDNLPDMTFTELLKIIAATTGTALNYTDAAGVSFDNLLVNSWGTKEIDGSVISEKKLTRRFGDYAQRNYVQFKSEQYAVPMQTIYTIANDNITPEKVLLQVPFSEGGLMYQNGIPLIYIGTREGQTDESASIASALTFEPEMARLTLTKNANLQTLCDASTEMELTAEMPLPMFEQIAPRLVILYKGTRYVWTEAQWSNKIATLKLSKIA